MISLIQLSLSTGIGLLYLLIAITALIRRGVQESSIRLLVIFLLTSAIWAGGQVGSEMLIYYYPANLLLNHLVIQGVVLLTFLYFLLSQAFLLPRQSNRRWGLFGIVVMLITITLQGLMMAFLANTTTLSNTIISQQPSRFAILMVGWAILLGYTAWFTFMAYQQAHGPLHRNRIQYWALAWGFFALADTVLFVGYPVVGSWLRLGGVILIVYAISHYRLLNINQILRAMLNYLIITILTAMLYLTVLFVVERIFGTELGYHNILPPVVLASLFLAVCYTPLMRFVQQLIDRFVLGYTYDSNKLIRTYSANISNILSLHRLGVISLTMLQQTFQAYHCTLFLVQPVTGQIRLTCIKSIGQKQLKNGLLRDNNPIVHYFEQTHQALSHYDFDMSPQFKNMARSERAWLSGLDIEVFVPIFAKNDWVGLFALGPKTNRKAYLGPDLSLLKTLAQQTAVALENAKLVEDLVKLNQNLKQAYDELDTIYSQRKELDNLKSAFIGVITHEMRTPFINVDFSLQLINRYGLKRLHPEQRTQLVQLKNNMQGAKRMVDNLVNFASFISQRAELYITPIKLPTLVNEAVVTNDTLIKQKRLSLTLDVSTNLPPFEGDEQRLKDAIYQLINNAVKFTPPKGKIWVRGFLHEDQLRLEVHDTGCGIPTNRLPHLWEGFAQMSDDFLRGLEGLGLGLTLVKYVVQAHRGEVFATSEEGSGSIFGFQIPFQQLKES